MQLGETHAASLVITITHTCLFASKKSAKIKQINHASKSVKNFKHTLEAYLVGNCTNYLLFPMIATYYSGWLTATVRAGTDVTSLITSLLGQLEDQDPTTGQLRFPISVPRKKTASNPATNSCWMLLLTCTDLITVIVEMFYKWIFWPYQLVPNLCNRITMHHFL